MNNHKTKSEKEDKKSGSLTGMMLQRDKNKNLEKLRKTRSQEYLRLLDVITDLSRELGELEEK